MDESTIIRLSELQERGTLQPDSEDALALIFAERYAKELRYVAMWGGGFAMTAHAGPIDDTLHVFDMVRDICREAARLSGKSSNITPSAKLSQPSSGWRAAIDGSLQGPCSGTRSHGY